MNNRVAIDPAPTFASGLRWCTWIKPLASSPYRSASELSQTTHVAAARAAKARDAEPQVADVSTLQAEIGALKTPTGRAQHADREPAEAG